MNAVIPNPLALIAELTHRCPLHCVYCSNPLELTARGRELSAETWARVFREAAELGVLQVDFTGGEPLARPDLVEIIRSARAAGLYASLISSGLPLDEKRLAELVAVGLDHFQLSFQGAEQNTAREFSGSNTHAQKLRVAGWVKRHHVALTLNFVVHRGNLHQLEDMIALTEKIEPGRVEFAHVQYYGWAFANRARLLPSRAQLEESLEILKSRLLCEVSEALHGRLGAQSSADQAGWRGFALPRRECATGHGAGECGAAAARPDLVRFRRVSEIPRRGMDAGALPHVPAARAGLWRVPVPGVFVGAGCSCHRSGLLAFAGTEDSG